MQGLASLNTFFASVRFSNPDLADRISEDVQTVAMHGILADKSGGKEAAERLRNAAFDMPVIHERVLASALFDLGY